MKVKIKLKPIEGRRKVIDVKTGAIIEEPETIYVIDIQDIKYNMVEYNPYKDTAIIEIADEDLDKVKDKVIEIIEQW